MGERWIIGFLVLGPFLGIGRKGHIDGSRSGPVSFSCAWSGEFVGFRREEHLLWENLHCGCHSTPSLALDDYISLLGLESHIMVEVITNLA